MRAVDGFAADSPAFCAEVSSPLSRLIGIQNQHEPNLPSAQPSDANPAHGEIASAAMKSKTCSDDDQDPTADLLSTLPLSYDIGALNRRAGRVAQNELIALNNQGANSRKVA